MTSKEAVASTVNSIFFNFKNFKPIFFKQILKRFVSVILEVLVTNISEVVVFEHGFESHQLRDKHPVLIQDLRCIPNELIGIVHIVKHSNGRNHFSFGKIKFS